MIEKTLINFCFNLEKYVTGHEKRVENSNLKTIQQGLNFTEPKTLGEKFRLAIDENKMPMRYVENQELIFDAIKARNAYVHYLELPKLSKYLVQSLQNKLSELCINESQIKIDDINLVNNVYMKAVNYLQAQYKIKQDTLGKMILELKDNKELEKIKYRFWDFTRMRNYFFHFRPSFTPDEIVKIKKFDRFLEERLLNK